MWDPTAKPGIAFSDEQAQLLEIASSFARDKFPMDKARARIAAAEDFDSAVWREMASLGWLGVAIPEEFGGSGLSLAEAVTIAEPLGRNVAGTPLVSTTLVAQALMKAGTDAQKREWLAKIAEGAIGALALSELQANDGLALSGTKTFVTDAASADLAIVSVSLGGKPALVLLDKSALGKAQTAREIVIDETRRSYRVKLDGITVPKSSLLDRSKTQAALKHIDEAACLLLAAEMCGGAAGVIAVTIEYLKTRKQFGRYIGSYQALKHPMVDALVALDAARSHLYYAAGIFGRSPDSEIAVRMAKAQAGDALAFASDRAIQFHGGFGFTYDCDAQLYRRLGIWCDARHGDAAYQRRRLADLIL